jgi:hypothetical protein
LVLRSFCAWFCTCFCTWHFAEWQCCHICNSYSRRTYFSTLLSPNTYVLQFFLLVTWYATIGSPERTTKRVLFVSQIFTVCYCCQDISHLTEIPVAMTAEFINTCLWFLNSKLLQFLLTLHLQVSSLLILVISGVRVTRNRLKCSPTHFFCQINTLVTWTLEKSTPRICATFVIKKLPPKTNRPIGENSANLGSLLWSHFSAIFANFRRKNWRFS